MSASTDEQQIPWTRAKWPTIISVGQVTSEIGGKQQKPLIGLDASLVARYVVMKPVGHTSSRPAERFS